MNLTEAFEDYGSDKGRLGYGLIYENLFRKFKDSPVKILELGVWLGASIYAWKEYFPEKSTIIGLDESINIKSSQFFLYEGKQDDPEILTKIIIDFPSIDIIIDDCSHQWGPQQDSFLFLWPYISPGGIYIIEDIGTSYESRFSTPNRAPTVNIFRDKIDSVVLDVRFNQQIESIQFYTNLCVITKRP